ncbi:MAG: hypothetical protein ACLVL7_01135 [Anaerotruncus massiliensis (ex Togo et al. 2019)]
MSALTGALPGKSEEEVIAELNRVVDEGMFNIAINSYITFPDAKGEGVANIENVPGNRYNMTVSIVLDDTGETVYQSKGIKPGQYIQKIRLDEELPEGFYYATAVFTAYAQDEAHPRRPGGRKDPTGSGRLRRPRIGRRGNASETVIHQTSL